MGRENFDWPFFWTRMALKLVGGDATVDECNDFLKTLGEKACVTAQTIEDDNTNLQMRDPAKSRYTKKDIMYQQLGRWLHTIDGREMIKQAAGACLSQEEILQLLGARVSLSLDFSQTPPTVTWRISQKKRKPLQRGPKKKTR